MDMCNIGILRFSAIDEDLSSFSSNQGTPLIPVVKNKERTSLLLKEEMYFTNNTGVLGGACGLHNTDVMIQSNRVDIWWRCST